MSSTIGEKLKVTLFGQSHSEAIGVVIDGLPAGEEIDLERVAQFLARRAPGQNETSTARKEPDMPHIVSGLVEGRTCGAPLCAMIANTDVRSADYDGLRRTPRPSHADYTAHVRYGGHHDIRGGGHFSGRLTAPLCVAGAMAMQILQRRGVYVGAHVESVGDVCDRRFAPVLLDKEELALPASRAVPVLDEVAGEAMVREIRQARSQGDSIGGVIECAAIGMPPGIGDPMFGGIENRLSLALFGIPGVRGIEFGSGFAAARMRGSAHNDPFCVRDGAVSAASNHHGGIIGGITSGLPICFRVAIKPTASIATPQQTVDLAALTETTLEIKGRHDPCIALRAVPCVEAAAAITLLDCILLHG